MMAAPTDRPAPDRLHVLPHPRPRIDPATEPLVGNASVDDNLAELAQVAMWNAIGTADRSISLTVQDGVATLTGILPDRELRAAVTAAVGAVPGIREVKSGIMLGGAGRAHAGAKARRPVADKASEPFVYLTRYCGLEEASTSAAIGDAITRLDRMAAATGVLPSDTLILRYRNRLPAAITLDIGVPIAAAIGEPAEGEFRRGVIPGQHLAEVLPDPGIGGILSAIDGLASWNRIDRGDAALVIWQRLAAADFRPWRGHLPVPVFASVAE